jgi:hypothetical protein
VEQALVWAVTTSELCLRFVVVGSCKWLTASFEIEGAGYGSNSNKELFPDADLMAKTLGSGCRC